MDLAARINIGVFAIIGDTLYITVTHTTRDRYDDVTNVPSGLYAIPALQLFRHLMWGFSKVPGLNYISQKVDDALPYGHVGD